MRQAGPRIRVNQLNLAGNNLTAAGVASLAPALRRPWGGDIGPWGGGGLKCLYLQSNPGLGDDGVAAPTPSVVEQNEAGAPSSEIVSSVLSVTV